MGPPNVPNNRVKFYLWGRGGHSLGKSGFSDERVHCSRLWFHKREGYAPDRSQGGKGILASQKDPFQSVLMFKWSGR